MRVSFAGSRVFGMVALGVALVLLTALTGAPADAVDPLTIQDRAAVPAGSVASETVGQTFVSHANRLHAVAVQWAAPAGLDAAPGSRVTLHLRANPGTDSPDLAIASLPLSAIRNGQFLKFEFAPIPDSDRRTFFFFLVATPDPTASYLSPWASDADDYADGAMYLNGTATDRDLVFRTFYSPDLPMLLGALANSLRQYGRGILAVLLLLLVLGLSVTWVAGTDALAASGVGLGALAAGSLLLLLLKVSLLILGLLGAVICLVAFVQLARGARRGGRRPSGTTLLLIGLAIVSFCIALLQIRDTPAPLWVDSFTHAQLIQALLSHGQLPAAYFYHLGYHAVTALVLQLTGWAIPQAMLLMGPVLITQVGMSLFLLNRQLTGSTVAGLTSAISVWFLSPTPSYFTTWGRYPLLFGSALLPLALWATVRWIEDEQSNGRALTLALLLGAGLAFAHVRLIVFYFVFVVVYAGMVSFGLPRARRRTALLRVSVILGWGLSVVLLWFAFVLVRGLTWQSIVAENAAAPSIDLGTAVAVAFLQHGRELAALALGSALLGLWRRNRMTWVVVLWFSVLSLIAFLPPSGFGAPISPDLVVLMAFVPITLLIGRAAALIYAWMNASDAPRARAIAWAVAACVVLLGARDMVSIVNPATIQFSQADSLAAAWVRGNTPASGKFLVNSFNWYSSTYVPSDGGEWIPFVSQRAIDYLKDDSIALARDPDALADWALAHDIHWVYLGWRPGILSRSDLACHPDRYDQVYAQEGVEIYRVLTPGEIPIIKPEGCNVQGMQFSLPVTSAFLFPL